jgi:hypothetical protein
MWCLIKQTVRDPQSPSVFKVQHVINGNTQQYEIPATATSSQRAPIELPESSQRAPSELPSLSLSEICVLISQLKTADKQSFLGTTW